MVLALVNLRGIYSLVDRILRKKTLLCAPFEATCISSCYVTPERLHYVREGVFLPALCSWAVVHNSVTQVPQG